MAGGGGKKSFFLIKKREVQHPWKWMPSDIWSVVLSCLESKIQARDLRGILHMLMCSAMSFIPCIPLLLTVRMAGTQVFCPRSKKTTPDFFFFQRCCWKVLGCPFLSTFTYTQKSTLQEWGTWGRKLYRDYQGVRKPELEPVFPTK